MAEDLPFDFGDKYPRPERTITTYGPEGEWTSTGYSYKKIPPTAVDTVREMTRGGENPLASIMNAQTDEDRIRSLMSLEPLMLLPRGLGNLMRTLGVLPPVDKESVFDRPRTRKLET